MIEKKKSKTKLISLIFILSIFLSCGLTYHFVAAEFSGNLEDLPYYVGAEDYTDPGDIALIVVASLIFIPLLIIFLWALIRRK